MPLCRLALIGQRILTWNHTQAAPITKFYVAKYPNVQRGEIPSNFIAAEHLYAPSSSILGKMGLLMGLQARGGCDSPPQQGWVLLRHIKCPLWRDGLICSRQGLSDKQHPLLVSMHASCWAHWLWKRC